MQDLNAKYVDIVKAGKELFWKFGIKKVNVAEICHKAEVSRATFYKYFENKEKLALYILKSVVDNGILDYSKIMNSDVDFPTKIKMTIQLKLEGSKDLSQEFLNDIYKDEFFEIAAYFNHEKEESLKRVMNDYQQAQFDGHIRMDLKPEFILYIMNKIHEMITDKNLTVLYENPSDKIGEIVRFFFYGILSREER